MIYKTFFFFN